MKGQTYRQSHPNKSNESVQSSEFFNDLFDNRLHYLNRSFQHNLKIQEIYLDIIKNKKTIHAKELKDYYNLFTNSKAQSLMFDHEIHHTQNLELNQNNKEMVFSLKRLYCRLIQKIMLKISYYLINKPSLNFAYAYASELIKRCETLMRRLSHLKDLNNMNQVIQKIFQENQEFQEHILSELINHGYINSVDQFYRINGIDLDHRQIYQRNQQGLQDQEPQQPNIQKKIKFKVKYQTKLLMNSSFKKQIKYTTQVKNNNHSVGMVDNAVQRQIQTKYKDLIISLDKLITQESFQEIVEAKEIEEKDQTGDFTPPPKNAQQNQSASSTTSKFLPQTQVLERKPIIRNLSQARTIIRRRGQSKKTQQQQYQQLQSRSELHRKQITIQSLNSSSIIPDVAVRGQRSRGNTRKYSSPFSRSFVNAIKSIEKINLIDQSSRLTAKRMSQHIIQFHKQSQFRDPLSCSQNSTGKGKQSMMRALKKNNHNKSIIKLLNIYKNRTLEEYIGQAQKGIFDNKQLDQDQIRQANSFKLTKKTDFIDKQNANQFRLSEKQGLNYVDSVIISNDYSLEKHSILRKKAKQSKFKQSRKKMKHLEHLKSQLTEIQLLNRNNEGQFERIQSKKKHPTKTSIFQNFRLSQKISLGNLFQTIENKKCSLNSSPQRPLQSASILTSSGIESVDPIKYNLARQKARKMNKTVDISPTQTPIFPTFEVYDRIRRVRIK